MKSNKSIGATLGYNLKEESQIIDIHNLNGDSIQDYGKQMRMTQELFEGRAKNLTAHIILSPSIEDGNNNSVSDWKEIAKSFLAKAKLDKYESIIFVHEDKGHKHLHIVANRIDSQGKIYRNGDELRLSQRIGNEIARERGMKQAKEVMRANQRLRSQGIEPQLIGSMQEIRNELNQIVEQVIKTSQSFDQEKYFTALEKLGYKLKLHLNKDTGEIRGYGIERKETYYNSSDIGNEYTLNNLKKWTESVKKIEKRKESVPSSRLADAISKKQSIISKVLGDEKSIQVRRYDYINDCETVVEIPKRIQEDFKKALDSIRYLNLPQFKLELEKKGIDINVDLKKTKYSLTKEGHTLYASEIGKKYTLGSLESSKRHQNTMALPENNSTAQRTLEFQSESNQKQIAKGKSAHKLNSPK